ncbi:hypothetical protein ACWC9T_05425 [Kitasatospora sp. NPDC001159]
MPGPKLLEGYTEADTQDLLLQNHDVFFVDTRTCASSRLIGLSSRPGRR